MKKAKVRSTPWLREFILGDPARTLFIHVNLARKVRSVNV